MSHNYHKSHSSQLLLEDDELASEASTQVRNCTFCKTALFSVCILVSHVLHAYTCIHTYIHTHTHTHTQAGGNDSDKERHASGGDEHESANARQQRVAAISQGSVMRDAGKVFVCGFGNRLTDTAAYAAVGVPPERNFLIDERSQVSIHCLCVCVCACVLLGHRNIVSCEEICT